MKRAIPCILLLFISFLGLKAQDFPPDTGTLQPYAADTIPKKKKDGRNSEFINKLSNTAAKTASLFSRLSYVDSNAMSAIPGNAIYKKHKGKVIGQINIIVLEPFGTSVYNVDSLNPLTRFQERANRMHISTREWAVRNDLLFEEGDVLDPQLIADSERLLWERRTYKNIRLVIKPAAEDKKQVDVTVILQDRFTLSVTTRFSAMSLRSSLNFVNFLGIPQTISAGASLDINPGDWYSVFGSYNYNNIGGSRVDGYVAFKYRKIGFSTEAGGIREFFSHDTRWGGGFRAGWQNIDTSSINDELVDDYSQSNNYQDLRFTYAFKNKNDDPDYVHWLVGIRLQRQHFNERPFLVREDGAFKFAQNNRVLLAVGVAPWNYYTDRFVYYQGLLEYFPKGASGQVIFGSERDELWGDRLYLGAHAQFGRYFWHYGYNLFDFSYGGYFTSSKYEQIHIGGQYRYYSKQVCLGRWTMRQFWGNFLYLGFRRPAGSGLMLKEQYGLKGIENPVVRGMKNIVVNLETSFYMPKRFLGFHTALFINMDFALIGQESWSSMFNGPLQQAYGVGIRGRSPGKGIDNIEIAFYWYPKLGHYDISTWGIAGGFTNYRQPLTNSLYNLESIHTDY